MTVDEVIQYMVDNAQVQPDGTGIFVGSPRPLWETSNGVSSGPKYHALYDAGLRRIGRGRSAQWIIPDTIMLAHGIRVAPTRVAPVEEAPADEMPTVRLRKSKEEKKA